MADYRRHDAPDQNRPREVLSPWARAALIAAYGTITFGFLIRGFWGGLAAIGAVGIAATSAPKWTRNNVIERSESAWIVKRLERYYEIERQRAAHEARKQAKFENPSKVTNILLDAGCLIALLAVCTAIALSIVGIPSDSPVKNVIVWICGLALIPIFLRVGQFAQLQRLADEPRGGIKTVTLRDFAGYMEAWPNRLPFFLLSSALAIVAAILLI